MALNPKFSTGFRDALLEGQAMQSMFDGANSALIVFSGAQAADADAADPSGVISTVVIPTTNAFAATTTGTGSALVIAKAGTWQDTSIDATGTALSMRLTADKTVTGVSTTARRMDGSVGVGTFDLAVSSTSFTINDPFTVDTFTLTIPF